MHRALLLCAALAACGKPSESARSGRDAASAPLADAATPLPIPSTPDAAPAPAPPTLERRDVVLDDGGKRATIAARIPAGWEAGAHADFTPPGDAPDASPPLLAFEFGGYACAGTCKDADYRRELDAVIDGARERWERPNITTDPVLAAVRLTVTELEQGKLADGRYIALKVEKPADVEGPYPEVLTAVCARRRPDDKFYVVARARVPLADEPALWPLLLEACKTWEVAGPRD